MVSVLGLLTYFGLHYKDRSDMNDYFISTQSQSNDRVSALNLNKALEDVSYILDASKLSFPTKKQENIDYKADPNLEWIIELIQVNGGNFKKNDFEKIFDYDWRTRHESTIYGLSDENNTWTFADAGDSPNSYSRLQVAIDLQDVYAENQNYEPEKLDRYIKELQKRIKLYPTQLRLEINESLDKAIIKAKKLVLLQQEINRDVVIVLQSKISFKGTDAWDTLQSLGLVWGDGDLFHWENKNDYGDEQYFSVWTSTEPNYFLPEEVKAGNMNPKNLIFGFSVPRSADPEHIFDNLNKAVEYCQKRLGGEILNSNGKPFDITDQRQNLIEHISKMKNKGITPGSEFALRMFN